jgi:hypothetical protein
VWTAVWLGTLAALGYAVENFRGHRAWKEARQSLDAAGAPYDHHALIPKPVPDDQNFGALPIVTNWFSKRPVNGSPPRTDDYFSEASDRLGKPKIKQNEPRLRTPTDLVAWSAAFLSLSNAPGSGSNGRHSDIPPTPDEKNTPEARVAAARIILAAMEADRAKFETFRDGLRLPHARYPVDYSSENAFAVLLPHLAKLKEVCVWVQLRVAAELGLGDSAAALADTRLLLGLGDTLKSEPFLISHLVRLATFNLAVQNVWEGLYYHKWQASELAELQRDFATYNFIADLQWAANGERAGAISTIDYCRQHHSFAILNIVADSDSESEPRPGNDLFGKLVPNGWFLMEMANYSRFMDRWLAGIDPAQRRVQPEIIRANAAAVERQFAHGSGFGSAIRSLMRHDLAARALLPAYNNTVRVATAAQSSADLVVIACALEQFRLGNGHLPDSIQAIPHDMLPQPPLDVVTGEPYKYKKNEGDSFLLYSVGWDVKDDAGKPTSGDLKKIEGDWTWGWLFKR